MKKNHDQKIVDQIESARNKNNRRWMDILRLAMLYAPDTTREVLKGINREDKRISRLLEKLTK